MLSALKELALLYDDIESKVFRSPAPQGNGTASVSEAVIRNRQLVARLVQMNASFSESAAQWLQRRERVSREERDQAGSLAESVRLKASHLLDCCQKRSTVLETALLRLRQELGQMRNGARFLQSSKTARTNYPKFIDSHG